MIGKTISHYKIIEKLGEGGMGVVYKAQDTKLKRTVALKFLPPGLDSHEPERARFMQEAQTASALNHHNICTIHDIAEHDGQQFIVMEYVEGKTLTQMVPVQKLKDAIVYAIQIGEALQEAHSKGVVHRDVKTDNIMVNTKNQIKVMDFGLAKLKGSLKLTRTSSTVGTLSYMAPEQIQGGNVDARSDIFSFGVVLYEMLTGHLPFRGEHEAAMVYSIVNEEPEPIQKYRPEVSSELIHILNRALEKDPEDRYQSVHDMVIDLRRVKKETSRVSRVPFASPEVEKRQGVVSVEPKVSTSQKRDEPRRTYIRLGLTSVLILTAAIVVYLVLHSRTPKLNPAVTSRTLEIPFTQINYPSLSRDGQWACFPACDTTNEWSIYFMNVVKGNPLRLTKKPFQLSCNTDFSPDASEILYDCWSGGDEKMGIYVVSSSGGMEQKIAEPGFAGKWHPNGQRIGYIRTGSGKNLAASQSGKPEFWTVKRDGTENRLVFVDSLSIVGRVSFDWSPDGNAIAWLRSFPGYNEIYIRDLKMGKGRQLTSYKALIDEVAWAPNGQILFSSSKSGNTNIWMIPASGGEAVQITRGTGPDLSMHVSADGRRLLFLEQRKFNTLWTAGTDGSRLQQLTFDNKYLSMPSFSPDKKRISFDMASSDALQSTNHIFVMQSDGTNRIPLTAGDAQYYNAGWSLDGKYMTYASKRVNEPRDSSRIYLVEVENPVVPRLIGKGINVLWINEEEFVVFYPLVFPHPHTVLYSIHSSEAIHVSEDSTNEYPLRDGRHMVVTDMRKGREGWWLKTMGTKQGTAPRQILPSESLLLSYPSVSLRYILYLQPGGEVWRISIPKGIRERLPGFLRGIYPPDIQMSFDDRQLVFLKQRFDSRLVLIENVFQ